MTKQEILEDIETILYTAEYTNIPTGWRFYTRKGSDSPFMGDPVTEYYNETVELLRALHQKLTGKEKDFLLNSLEPSLRMLTKQSKAYTLVYAYRDFIFMFYIKIKEIDKALKLISDRVIITEAKVNVFQAMNEVLTIEPETFDNIRLNEILSIVDNFNIFIKNLKDFLVDAHYIIEEKRVPAFDKTKINDYKASNSGQVRACEPLLDIIKNRIFKIKKERLSASLLEGVNFEVNQDQTQLQNIITEFGFNKKLNETISKINEKLYDAEDPFDFKNCIDLIRALLNELCVSIALEIQEKKQIQPTLPIDSMGTAEQYFRDRRVNFLTQSEHDFLAKYNAFISDAGVHALQSEREHARISRNLVIELGLFLVERLKKYLT